jgi:hypothetical protein
VLTGHRDWHKLSSGEVQNRIRVSEKRVPRVTFGPKGDEGARRPEKVACSTSGRNNKCIKNSVRKIEGKTSFERPRHKWQDVYLFAVYLTTLSDHNIQGRRRDNIKPMHGFNWLRTWHLCNGTW